MAALAIVDSLVLPCYGVYNVLFIHGTLTEPAEHVGNVVMYVTYMLDIETRM